MFREKLNLSRITESPRRITDRTSSLTIRKSHEGTPSVNNTTDMKIAMESMQFGQAFPRIFQAISEVDPDKGPIRALKLDIMDLYHRGTLLTSQFGAFAYVIPSAPEYYGTII